MIGARIRLKRKENGYTLEEVAQKLGVSKQTVQRYETGVIANIPSDKIELLSELFNTTPAYLMGWDTNVEKIPLDTDTITVKVYGSVPAGQPIEAIEDVIGYEEIPAAWTRFGKEFIALVVKGDSMYPKYFEGDTVIIEVTPDCNNGQDAVVYVNGYDATLKEVHKNDDGSVTLKPFNPEYPPKTYQPDKDVDYICRCWVNAYKIVIYF